MSSFEQTVNESQPIVDNSRFATVKRWTVGTVKVVLLLVFLYFFICSLDLLSSAFRLFGGKSAGKVFQESVVMSNPIAGLMIGILATVLVQSSSTSTSIVVTMTNAGIVRVDQAIYILMGANIGTSVTNTLVAVVHGSNRDEFKRAFAGATVHDMFNWLNVLVLLPVEVITSIVFGKGYLVWLSGLIVGVGKNESDVSNIEMLKVITDPFTDSIIKVDKKIINDIATGIDSNGTIAKHWCTEIYNSTTSNSYWCRYLLNANISDTGNGAILLVISLALLIGCLVGIVKVLNSSLHGRVAQAIKQVVNAHFPYPFKWATDYAAIVVGAILTFIIQSSSVFTSTLTPLVGVGILSLERVYPLTLGSNLGTTGTAIIAALSADNIRYPLQAAMCHFLFNLTGIFIWFPIPFMRNCPLRLARFLGETTAEYRWFAVAYVILMFLLFPLLIFALSMAGWGVLLGFLVPLILVAVAVAIITLLQKKKPKWLPKKLRNWQFLPEPLRSLAPLDRQVDKLLKCCKRLKRFKVAPKIDTLKATQTEADLITTKL